MLKKITFAIFMLVSEICFSQQCEKFDTDYLLFFFANKDFQSKRLKDTVTLIKFNIDDDKMDTFFILKSNWTYDSINLVAIEYDENFDVFDINKNYKTTEKVFKIKQYRTGFMINYYFKREYGLWYLVKKEDFSN